MVELQVISKVLEEKNIDKLIENGIIPKHFVGYENEMKFIYDHYNNYDIIPTKETFLSKFNELELCSYSEDWNFLVNGVYEGYMFSELAKLLQSSTKVVEQNALEGYQLLSSKLQELESVRPTISKDLIKHANERLDTFIKKQESDELQFVSTGFPEIDEKVGSWVMGEELVTIMARTNKGKSWILLTLLMNAWKLGLRVGIYSGEMSHEQMGYRFDALLQHFSNLELMRGKASQEEYKDYIEALRNHKNCFVIITPKDLGRQATVPDIDALIKKHNLQIFGIDQFSLMDDYRSKKGDPLRIRLGNISADLFNLSMKHKIPILALSQANRVASKTESPELEHMSESDAIAQNSTKVISMNRIDNLLSLRFVKNRYGRVGDEFFYKWDIDKGIFSFDKFIEPGNGEDNNKKGDNELSSNKQLSRLGLKFSSDGSTEF